MQETFLPDGQKQIIFPVPDTLSCKSNGHLYRLNKQKKGIPLFVIPGIGGKTDRFRMFGNILNCQAPVFGLEMMGTQRNEVPFKTISRIAEQNIRWMRTIQSSGPYRLVGHSYGAYILFEMVRQLEAMNDMPEFVVVLDQPLDQLYGISSSANKKYLVIALLELARDYFESFRILTPPYPEWGNELIEELTTLEMEDMVPAITKFITAKLPSKANSIEYVSRLINIRFYNTHIHYKPSGRIHTEVNLITAVHRKQDIEDESLGWSVCADNINTVMVEGNHHSIVWGTNVMAVTAFLKQRIKKS